MPGKKIPVTVPLETSDRLDALVKAVTSSVTPTAARAIDRSMICRHAILNLLDRYENDPNHLVTQLGFVSQAHK